MNVQFKELHYSCHGFQRIIGFGHEKVSIKVVMTTDKLVNLSSTFLMFVCNEVFELLYPVEMIIQNKLPITSDTSVFLLSSITYNDSPKVQYLGGIKPKYLIIFRCPSIKPDLKQLGDNILINNITDSPVSLVILSINEIIDFIYFP